MTRLGLICGVAALALAGCERATAPEAPTPPEAPAPGAPAVDGFTHPAKLDLFGYYLPKTEVSVGRHRLSHLHLGSPDEFAEWTAGRRTGTYAPVMLEFDDTQSPTLVNELGQEVHATTERVLPDAWRVSDTEIAFVGAHPRLGRVSFQGRLESAAVAQAKAPPAVEEIVIVGPDPAERAGLPRDQLKDPGVVLVGTLTVAGQTFADVAFTWFGGD